jgi:hypothetical protein
VQSAGAQIPSPSLSSNASKEQPFPQLDLRGSYKQPIPHGHSNADVGFRRKHPTSVPTHMPYKYKKMQ